MKARVLGLLVSTALLFSTLAGVPTRDESVGPGTSVLASGGEDTSVVTPAAKSTNGTQNYPFYPLAGNLGRDIFVNNYVDLDPGAGVQIYDCSAHSYNGHDAHDVSPRGSFVEQEIGIPVYAALDGYVTRVRDGEPDHVTVPANAPANFVQLYHGGGHVTGYLHLKKDSVGFRHRGQWRPWQVGDFIRAGTQLGLMASSGNSTGPHLHFSSHTNSAGPPSWNGTPYEPHSGACDPGPSDWLSQVDDPTTPIVHDFAFSPNPFTGNANPPEDLAVRTGAFTSGPRTVHFRADLAGVEAGDSWRVRFLRPDASVAVDSSGTFGFGRRGGFGTWTYNFDLNQTGNWRMVLDIAGINAIQAPFEVLTSGTPPNRPPLGVGIALDPAAPTDDEAVFCRITSDPAIKDLDYDRVTYRWVWRINGAIVRDVVTAARADAIPHHVANGGNGLACAVTPNDGTVDGPTATTSAIVLEGAPEPRLSVRLVGHGKVTSAAGIACPGDCSEVYGPPTFTTVTLATTTSSSRQVTLKAVPRSNRWKFKAWSGACARFGTSKTCTITVSQPVQVKATFRKRA